MNGARLLLGLFALTGGAFSQTQEPVPTQLIAERAVATVKIPGYADFLVADGEAVWATNEGRVEKLDKRHTRPAATVPVPEPCGAMALGFGALWFAVCRDSSLYRIDRRSARVTAVIPTGLADAGGELSVAVGAGSVWILSDRNGVLTRVNPKSNQIETRIKVAPLSYAAAYGFNAVWITNTCETNAVGPGSVQRIDPRSNKVVATIPVGPAPRFLAAGEGARLGQPELAFTQKNHAAELWLTLAAKLHLHPDTVGSSHPPSAFPLANEPVQFL